MGGGAFGVVGIEEGLDGARAFEGAVMLFDWPKRWRIGSCAELFALDHSVHDPTEQFLVGDLVGAGIVGAVFR
jgi:hypothetical protein